MACILSLARFPAPNCPWKHERVYASSPSPFHIKINGPSSNYIAKKPRTNNRLNMTTFFSIASVPQQIQAEKDEDGSKQTLIERIGKYPDSLVPGGDLQIESLDEALGIFDLVQRLGIQRFFQQQIHRILESLHSKWDEKYRLAHANLTILGFLLLRFHGYHVTAGLVAVAAAAIINNDHDNSSNADTDTKINSINVNEDNNNNTSTSTSTITTTSTTATTTSATPTSATPTTKEEQGQDQEQEQNNNKSLFVTQESHPDIRRLTN